MCGQTFLRMSMVGLICVCVGVSARGAAPEKESEIEALAKARLEAAVKGFESSAALHQMWIWSERILKSELALSQCTDNRIAALERQLRRTEKMEKMVVDGQKQGTYTSEELAEAQFYRLDTLYKLAEERVKKSSENK